MAITFPSLPFGSTTEITLTSSATDHKPFLGGPKQRIARLGDKWSLRVDCRKMYPRQAGPIIAALLQGLNDQIIMTVPQPGIDTGVWTTGTIALAVTAGRSISVNGGGAEKVVGQLFSIEKNGVHYLHQITAVQGSTLTILPSLKVSLAGGETVNFGAPKIQGFVSGNSQSWSVGLAENLGLSFQIDEAR
ncbi:hypothetical protein [Novosphingobium sp.]|jgi:hypothetical protein|uniref:hypothetical protein n=1 Tax=Novosphingobium sp. TaxID=1874826 RepID=UPI002FE2E202